MTSRRQTQNPERGRKHVRRRRKCPTARVVRPKTPRGDGNMCAVAVSAPRPVSSDPKPREGTETFRRQFVDHEFSESSDPKPREGTETMLATIFAVVVLIVVRPKTPRGDGNPTTSSGIQSHGYARSSDPKPREGTETCIHSSPTRRTSASRQTQNPERGRKPISGTATLREDTPSRQTQNPERGRKPASGKSVRSKRFQRVVRPKTPRGDGNSKSSTTSAAAACSRSRQTQNPERGRKLNNTFFERGAVESVVRPKTPRGDGNPRRKGHRS
ncbi:hypothetical protein BO00_01415 [Mycobacterium tuberculosis EAS054]|nr:hypothetical protein BO00_01415 [Mycobacterium tuberculosis EAS054]